MPSATSCLTAMFVLAVGAYTGGAVAAPGTCDALRVKVIDVGLYQPIAHERVDEIEGTAHQQVSGAMEFVRATREVPVALGRMFGFTWLASGFEPGAPTVLAVDIDHPWLEAPEQGGANGVSSHFPVVSRDGRYRHALAWQLTEPHELVAGAWTLRLRCGGRVLAEERFELTQFPH